MDVIAVTLGVWLVSWEKLSEPEKFLMTWNTYRLMSIETTSSLTPDPPDLGAPEGIKIGHVLAYTWLMLWFAQI